MKPTHILTGLGKLVVVYLATSLLTLDPKNARKHTKRQIAKLAKIIKNLGFTNPILIDEHNNILAGHARRDAALMLNMETVPCIRIAGLSQAQRTALSIADNKLSDESQFDKGMLAELFASLEDLNFDVELTGFDTAEVDIILEVRGEEEVDPADSFAEPEPGQQPVTTLGDVWRLGGHRLICGNSLEPETCERLLDGEKVSLAFADPPYNVRIDGHVSGLGRAKHREFAMASGEMQPAEFIAFLTAYMKVMLQFSVDGSIHFHCMDWRHLGELLEAGKIYSELKALCVWNKTNAGMGSLYRSKHELVLVYKNGTAPHINNVELGRFGRYRTNVWDYPGANTFRKGRDADLEAHPTVKPVSLVADAIRDCSRRGDLILDPFAGSGTTILAAERTKRRAAAIEIDPVYVDVAIRRWEALTGKEAILASDGRTFAQVAADRNAAEVGHD